MEIPPQKGSSYSSDAGNVDMIDVKTAVQIAANHLGTLYEGYKIYDILLEEVERSEDGKWWLVTLGFSRPLPPQSIPALLKAWGAPDYKREFKVFQIDSTDGLVRSMKIRKV